MSTKTKWACVWAAWGIYFAAAEYVAIASGELDAPLSAHLRDVLGAKHTSRARRFAGMAVMCGGSAWLVDHIFWGIIDTTVGSYSAS